MVLHFIDINISHYQYNGNQLWRDTMRKNGVNHILKIILDISSLKVCLQNRYIHGVWV